MTSYQEKKRRYQKRERLRGKHHQELRDRDNKIHELEQKLLFAEQPFKVEIANLKAHVERLTQANLDLQLKQTDMLLWCPECHERHIDEGDFETKEHHTHACQHCGHVWRPAIVPTRGVRFLPGFKNGAST